MRRAAIPRTVWMLGFVSLCMDCSSELIHALLPIFLVGTLGMSVAALGLLEGLAEAAALIVKVFSGPVSDWLGQRKALLLAGYGLSALTKPLFPLASSPAWAITARLLDRAGKGIRGAPRDALIADVAPPEARGASFGLRQSMDTYGAVAGPLAAMGLMLLFADQIRAVLWFAAIPAAAVIVLLLFGVHEPQHAMQTRSFRSPLQWRALRELKTAYWQVVLIGALFTLARFSEAFLVLRAQQTGLDSAWVPGVMVLMSFAYALCAYPLGRLSDRLGRGLLLACGLVLLAVADLLLAASTSVVVVFLGAAVWGLHMGFTQGTLAAMVADTAPPSLRGTAFGLFNLACGICMLGGSALAGWLWSRHGAPLTFIVGAVLAGLSLVLYATVRWRNARAAKNAVH
jgi:MFS family permease